MERTLFSPLRLASFGQGDEADFYLIMTLKEAQSTRDGKPYFRVGFRDNSREVVFPIWNDSKWYTECCDVWQIGRFYKVRAVGRQTNYGLQLDIQKIRPVTDSDRDEGFDPGLCVPTSRFDRPAMFGELTELARREIRDTALAKLVVAILEDHRKALLEWPAAARNHHAFVGGLLEHTLSVARNCVLLADKYSAELAGVGTLRDKDLFDKDLVVAGGILHDLGKLRELKPRPEGTIYTPEGQLLGHILQGRDMLREAAARHPVPHEMLLRLEHVIVSHQRLPEWGSPKPPMTLEALVVHFADDLDAKLQMMVETLRTEPDDGSGMTSHRNALKQSLFRGLPTEPPGDRTAKPR
jgi:3'-5' exoribonuclease